jgi:hypothetical protein
MKVKIGLEGKKEEVEIRSLLTGGLNIKGCRGLRNYMARIEILINQYTNILADQQRKINPYNVNEEMLREMTLNYVKEMVDKDGQIIIAIYKEVINYGLDKERQDHFKRLEVNNNIRKGETPFESLRSLLDEMNLKIDAMTSHGFDYRNVTINNVNEDPGCKFCKDKGYAGKHSNVKCWFNPQSKGYKPNITSKRKENPVALSAKKTHYIKQPAIKKAKGRQVNINNLQAKEEEEEEEEEEVELPT